jgi:hypothetical protein
VHSEEPTRIRPEYRVHTWLSRKSRGWLTSARVPRPRLLVFEGDELIFEGSDRSTHTVLGPDMDIAEACGRNRELGGTSDGRTETTDLDPEPGACAGSRTR